jgi:hypothetical protein
MGHQGPFFSLLHLNTWTVPFACLRPYPRRPAPRQVTIGNASCKVISWSDTAIVCTAPPGVGSNPALVVTVAGQSNAVSRGLVGYFPPALSGFVFPSNADASGGAVVAFVGRDLGPPVADLVLLLGDSPCVVVMHSHMHGLCRVSPGAGRGLPVVVVRGSGLGTDADPEGVTTSVAATFSYDPPVIMGITPVDPTRGYPAVGGFSVLITGTSFTTLTDPRSFWVTVSGSVCANPINRTHTTVVCVMPANFGRGHPVVVWAGGQASAPFLFDYDPPVILSVRPEVTLRGGSNSTQPAADVR